VKKALSLAISAAALLGLTACDPPLPPEVRTAILEQTVTCESGDVAMAADGALISLVDFVSETITYSCSDAYVALAEDEATADLMLTASPDEASGYSYLPFALDASLLVTNLTDLGSLTLSASSIEKILAGEITMWNDVALVADNPFENLPEVPIILVDRARPEVINAFEIWMSRLLGREYLSGISADSAFDYNEIAYGEMGSFGLLSFHDNFDAYLLSAGVATDGEGGFVGADLQSIASAGTQLEVAVDGVVTSLVMNFGLEPQAQAGSDAAPYPYQAIFPLYLGYRLEGALAAKAAGMFVLRSDTQGDIEQFNLSMLPEAIRIEAVGVISQGLPQPELTKEQLALLGLD
jgi:phosphate transport system substrate-binding protein